MNLFDSTLYQNVRKPLEQATGLPPRCYTDSTFYQREVDTIFHQGWVMVGREDRIAAPGSWCTVEFTDVSLVLTRDAQGQLHALANACRHRGAPLAHGEGQSRNLVCPYHAWSYSLDGKLIAAPAMGDSIGFSTDDYPLHPARVDTWAGFMFVCVSDDVPPLSVWLGDLPKRLEMYGFGRMRSARRLTFDLQCNWKVWVENFMEGYHIPTVHRSTISRQKAINIPEDPGRGEYTAIYERHEGTRALLHGDMGFPPIETLTGDSSQGSRFILIYPAAMLAIANDTMWCFEAHPGGPERTQLVLTSCFPEQRFDRPDFQALAANYFKRQDIVVREDNDISELQQRGLQSWHATPGRFCIKEKIVHALDNWVLDRVLGEQHGAGSTGGAGTRAALAA